MGGGTQGSSKRRIVSCRGKDDAREELGTLRQRGREKLETKETKGGSGRAGAAVLIPMLTNAEMKWRIVWQGTGSTNMWNLCYCYPER